MWYALCVNISEVLEVRGAPLTEEESWVLLHEIGRRLKNVPTPVAQKYIIVPENIELHHNGGLSIKFTDRPGDGNFPNLPQIKLNNVLVYTLGMTILQCLQNFQEGSYHVSEELKLVLSMMTSPESTAEELSRVLNGSRFQTEGWDRTVSRCFQEMYESVFGSISELKIDEFSDDEEPIDMDSESNLSSARKGQVLEADIHHNKPVCEPIINDPISHQFETAEEVPLFQEQTKEKDGFTQTDNVTSDCEIPHSLSQEKESKPRHVVSPTSPKPMLRCKDSPKIINLCTEKSDFKRVARATVEYLDGRKLDVSMEIDKISSGHLLGLSLPFFVPSVNPTAFCLTLLLDGEYYIMSPTSSIGQIARHRYRRSDLHFFVRLRFMPLDINLIQEPDLLQTVYLQTRRDLLDGFLSCNTEESLLLAAYSLQYEIGNVSRSSKPFRMRDFVPPNIIDLHGSSYLRTSLCCLHGRLNGMDKLHARSLYLCKASELPDYGTHMLKIYLTKKCENSVSARLSVGPKGMKTFKLHTQNRTTLHEFTWDQLEKISYKKNAVILHTTSKEKLKFYTEKQRRSRYIIRMFGETHQHHRYYDFHSPDQSYYPPATTSVESPMRPPIHEKVTSEERPRISEITHQRQQEKALSSLAAGSGSELSLSSGHPQITPFGQDSHDDNTTSNLEENFRSMYVEPRTPNQSCHQAIAKADVHNFNNEENSSAESESSDDFDQSEIPAPVLEIPAGIRNAPNVNQENEHLQEENDFNKADDVVPVMDRFVAVDGNATEISELVPVTNNFDDNAIDTSTPSLMLSHISRMNDFANVTNTTHQSWRSQSTEFQGADLYPLQTSFEENPEMEHSQVMLYTDSEDQQHFSREETASRGEGDGISNFSGPDHQPDLSKNHKNSGNARAVKDDAIPEAATFLIADFEEFKRRLSQPKKTSESSVSESSEKC